MRSARSSSASTATACAGHRRPTYVDLEGDIVWTQEYLRYRVNQCDHATAVQRVLDQIDGRGVAPVCGNPPPGGAVPFPPRNEPFAFRQQLELKYRDGLRRSATSSYVDIEGAIVWTQEYLRYRVNRCGHEAATQKVLDQIDGKGIASVCASGPEGLWDGEAPGYWNSPFTMEISLRGTSLGGRYQDRYDRGTLWGTYEGGPVVVINAYFGDGGIRFDGEFDGPEQDQGHDACVHDWQALHLLDEPPPMSDAPGPPATDIKAQMDAIYGTMAPDAIPWNKEDPPAMLVELVETGTVEPCDAIDLGCGAGNYAVWLASRGFCVTGVDVSANAIAMATRLAEARRVSCRFVQADLTSAVPDDVPAAFDFAYDWEVLHHVFPDDRARYAANVRRLLRPGGRYLSVCFSEADAPAFGGEGKWVRTPLGTLLYLSSEREIAELFEPVFRVDELRTVEIAGRHGTHVAIKALMSRRE